MTERDLAEAPWDPANRLLKETDSQVLSEFVQTPDGGRVALTIRTSSTTTTVFLRKGNAITVADDINNKAGQIASPGLEQAMQEG